MVINNLSKYYNFGESESDDAEKNW
jgi:hypothetical protein